MESEEFSSQYLCVLDGQTELEDVCDEVALLDLNESETDTCVLIDEENETQVIKTKLRLCRNEYCEGCNNLHLCKLYLFGDCPYNNEREECHFSHDLNSEHNVGVLCQHKLLELDFSELCIILLQNDTTLLPSVCLEYNEGSGKFGNCLEAETCENLHICENYIRGICDGSTDCSRCHDFYEPHPSKILQDNEVSNLLMGKLLPIYKNMLTIADADKPRIDISAIAPDICLFHFQNSCDLENTHEHVHFHLPYNWEQRDGDSWKVLPDNEEIERAFCDPTKTHSDGSEPIHFDSMTQSFVEVRRLSTISSIWDPSFGLTTKWIWYWEDEHGNWIQYESAEETHNISSITSEFLEWKYQENSSAVFRFTTAEHSYEVNMQAMMQYNKQSSTKTRVRRRPMFLSAEDVQNIITREMKSKDLSPNPQASLCDSDDVSMSGTGFKRVLLNSNTNEYKKIVERFYQTMSEFNVTSIEKVLNEDVREVFQRHVNVMNQKNVGKEHEKFLFHGTESKQVDAICQQNIDWRTCEAHETAYGKGGYFTRDAKSSHNYTDKSGTRSMFLCRVYIGEYAYGHPSYTHPPLKDGENSVFYDSCVNDINNPSTFVVFEKHQVYPEYLIHYEQKAGNSPQDKVPLNQFSSCSQARFSNPSVSSHFLPQYFLPQYKYPTPIYVPITASPIAPRFHYTPRVRSPFFAHQRPFQAGAAQSSFPRCYRPPLVRNFTFSNPTRPQRQQGSHRGFRSFRMHSPGNNLTHPRTAASFRKDTAKQQVSNPVRSASESCSMPWLTTLSTITKESISVKTQDARQQTSRPAGGLQPVNYSGSVSSGTKTSKSDRHRTSSDTGSTKAAGKSSRSSDTQSTKAAGKSSRSSDTQSTKPAGKSSRSSDTQSTKAAGKSSRSSDTQSTKPAGKNSKSSASQSTKPAGKNAKRR